MRAIQAMAGSQRRHLSSGAPILNERLVTGSGMVWGFPIWRCREKSVGYKSAGPLDSLDPCGKRLYAGRHGDWVAYSGARGV
jgi:hypothetical protein